MSQKRKEWIDIYKGIAILLVIIGHLNISPMLYRFIFSFHMYAFFFVSGFTYSEKKEQHIHTYIYNNFKKLVIPYFLFAFLWDISHLFILFYTTHTMDLSLDSIIKNILTVVLCGTIKSNASIGPAWFLIALFVMRINFRFLIKLTHNNKCLIMIVSIALFVLAYCFNGSDYLPFKIFSTLSAYLFMSTGYISKDQIEKIYLKTNFGINILMIIFFFSTAFIFSTFQDTDLLLVSNILPHNIVLVLLCAFAGIFGLIFLSFTMEKNLLSKLLIYYGRNSLIIMGTHSELHFLSRFLLEKIGISGKINDVITFFITIILVIPIIQILNNHFPKLVGHTNNNTGEMKHVTI